MGESAPVITLGSVFAAPSPTSIPSNCCSEARRGTHMSSLALWNRMQTAEAVARAQKEPAPSRRD